MVDSLVAIGIDLLNNPVTDEFRHINIMLHLSDAQIILVLTLDQAEIHA